MEVVKRPHSLGACDRPGLHTAFSWSGERTLSGFVVDPSNLARKFVVELLIDGLSVKVVRADEFAYELVRQTLGTAVTAFDSFCARQLGTRTMRAALAMVGAGNIDVTLASLHQQTQDQWVAASFPEAAALNDFDPKLILEFLSGDAADCDFVVFAFSGTALTATALERIAGTFVRFDHAHAVYGDLDIVGTDNSVWPFAFPAFDYERLLEQGYCAHCFALRRVIADRALASGASDLYRLFNCIFDHVPTSVRDVVHVPGAIAGLPEFDLNTRRPTLVVATCAHLKARGIVAQVTPAPSGVMPAVRVSRPADSEKTNHHSYAKSPKIASRLF